MPDDNQTQDVTAPVTSVNPPEEAKTPETSEIPSSDIFDQSNGSNPAELPPRGPESPIIDSVIIPVESANSGLNQLDSKLVEPPKEPEMEESGATASEQPAPAPSAPVISQTQSLAQQDQVGFIHSLLIKAQAKIQFNKQKKLDNLMQLAQKKRTITNSDVQKLLRVSDRTSTRYLVKLVQQGRLTRTGDPHDAKYQFVR